MNALLEARKRGVQITILVPEKRIMPLFEKQNSRIAES